MNSVMARRTLVAAGLAFFAFMPARSQEPPRDSVPAVLFVNDEWERYTRALQVSGEVPIHPWSIRAFGPKELERLGPRAAHAWSGSNRGAWRRIGHVSFHRLPASVSAVVNSSFPYGYNDGPVWAGRGLTTILGAGIAAKAGPLSAVLAPTVFRAENARFSLMQNGLPGEYRFGDAFQSGFIDQPQRFGDGPYTRVDPGNSWIRLDAGPAAVGFSTANQYWGPARDHPVLLGNNAGGFPHVFVGTSRPLRAWIVDAHMRLLWGKLSASEYTPMRDVESDRFATGLIGI